MNSSAYGLILTYTVCRNPSISIGYLISAFLIFLKLECTRVSSKSSTRVFLPIYGSFYGFNIGGPSCLEALNGFYDDLDYGLPFDNAGLG